MKNIYDIFEERKSDCILQSINESFTDIQLYYELQESFLKKEKKSNIIKMIKALISKFIKWLNDTCTKCIMFITNNDKIYGLLTQIAVKQASLEKNNCKIKVNYYPITIHSINSNFESDINSIKDAMKNSLSDNRDKRFMLYSKTSDDKNRVFKNKPFIQNALMEDDIDEFYTNRKELLYIDDDSKKDEYIYDVEGIVPFLKGARDSVDNIKKRGKEIENIYNNILNKIGNVDEDDIDLSYINSGLTLTTNVINFYINCIIKYYRQYLTIANKILTTKNK
jgi:hypothetical protein